ncbi:MAG: SDR family NAD(P)-dependent oxidoreductase, partial [Gammaproteobacteria bacterium]
MDNVLIVGCGDIGRRIAACLPHARLTGVVRSAAARKRLEDAGIAPVVADLDDAALCLPQQPPGTVVFHLAPPPRQGRRDPRTRHLLAALAGWRPARVVYISTSGVYGDCRGAWVDETWPARPQADRAWRRWDAERQLMTWSAQTGVPVVRLRVGGIYAPDRLPEERLRA